MHSYIVFLIPFQCSLNKKLHVPFSRVTITIIVCLDSPTLKLVLNRFFVILWSKFISFPHGVSVKCSLVCSVKEMEVSLVPTQCGIDNKLRVFACVIYVYVFMCGYNLIQWQGVVNWILFSIMLESKNVWWVKHVFI